jgi:hypothetical protein
VNQYDAADFRRRPEIRILSDQPMVVALLSWIEQSRLRTGSCIEEGKNMLFRLYWPRPIAVSIFLCFALLFLPSTPASAQTLDSGGRLWAVITENRACPSNPNRVSFVNVTDASTSTKIKSWAFSDTSGNIIRVLGGFAFDNTRRVVWYSSLNRSCTGPTQGDGFIYKRAARGGTVTAISDPGGPGGPGIGAMDYDAEEDVLWVAAFRPVNGQSLFYKLNPANGNVLKTFSIPAWHNEANDTLAIARPADLGGVKVLLTDAGANDTESLFALDLNTGAIVSAYPVGGLGGIDVDDETGDLLDARNGLSAIFVGNRGPAPYHDNPPKFGLIVETEFTTPPYFVGDIAIEPLSCDVDTIDRPGFQTASGHNWSMSVEVSDNDGIVLRDVKLGERYMAKEMSLPYYVLRTSALPARRAELMPDSTELIARSRLVSFAVNNDNEKLVIEGTYAVDKIPATSQSCLFITQRYEFHEAGIGCEPSETLPCARFKPIVKYRFVGRGSDRLDFFNAVQRHFFQVDGRPVNTVGLFRDCDNPLDLNGPCPGKIFEFKRNPLLQEVFTRVIENGSTTHIFDNFHLTYNSKIEEPGVDFSVIPPSLEQKPGCPECVHVHWRWGTISSNPVLGGGPEFGDGLPLIPPGSDQSVDFAVVRRKTGEEDPHDYTNLILDGAEGLPNEIVFWYSATGHLSRDTFFTHGGFFNPAFRNRSDQSGPVAVTYFNLFEEGPLTVSSIDPTTTPQLLDGYTIYANLAYDVKTDALVSGPHAVSINVPTATDPEVFASLRILHGEPDPNDPTRVVLIDRTILVPDPLAANLDTKTISARVDSFSPFVIARVSDITPPVSTSIVAPAPNADDWNNTDVTVTINATDNSSVRQITYTNELIGVTTTVLGATASVPVTIEGGNQITYYAIDRFGNVESANTIFVNLDKSPPFFLFIGSPNPVPNAAGWNNSDVSIDYLVEDDVSGIFPSQRSLVLSAEGAAIADTITITDRAGNSATETTAPIKIDKTKPMTTYNVSINGSQATITLSASDNLSGVAATSYSINGGSAQSYSAPFTVTGPDSHTISYYSTDVAGNIEATKTASFTIPQGPTTVTLVAIKDSFLRQGADDTNEGANERLRIQSSGHNRVLVAFDLSGISTANLVSATLVMNIAENSNNWGTSGQVVDIHRLLTDWTQGNGRNDVMVGGGPSFRGTGEGVTWNCSSDADISNQRADCGAQWNGGSFAAATAPGLLHTNGLVGEVRWNVTADVRAGAGFGWMIKKRQEGQSGQARYFSLEGVGVNQSIAPRLVLVYGN